MRIPNYITLVYSILNCVIFRPGLESCGSEKVRVSFSSVIKIVSKSSLILTNVDSQDELLLVGLENVLNDVTVTVSNPHFMYAGRPYVKGDVRAWPIGLKSVFWTEGTPGKRIISAKRVEYKGFIVSSSGFI